MNFTQGRAGAAMSSTAQLHGRYRHNPEAVVYCDQDRENAGEDQVR